MSYLVLARKWRPKDFDELLGQEHVSKTLQNAIKQNRLAHAFLFCGPRGVGKTSAARILAKSLICPNRKETKPCHQCSACEEISKGNSVDVIEIDGASNNGVDSIRELRERAHYLPTQGQNKVYIIDEVHMLSQSAFNALLKILEEPPPHLKFIFATTEPHKIPATILSRCQHFDFKKIPLKSIQAHLGEIAVREKIEIEKDALLKISKEARGSFRDGLSLLDQASSFTSDKIHLSDIEDILGTASDHLILKLLEHLFKKEAPEVFALLHQIYEKGQDVKQLSSELLDRLRALLLIKVTGAATNEPGLFELTDHEFETLKEISHLLSLEELEIAFQYLLKGGQDMSYTLYPQYVLEATLVKLLHLRPLIPLSLLLNQIEEGTSSPSSEASPQWGQIVKHVKTKKPSLAAILEHGYLTQLTDSTIHIGFPKNSVFYKLLSELENKSTLEKLMSEFLKRPHAVLISEFETNSDVTVKSLAKQGEDEADQIKKKILQQETIQQAQKIFDGKIVDVRIIKKEGEA